MKTLYVVDDPHFCGSADQVVWDEKQWKEYGESSIGEYVTEEIQEGDTLDVYVIHENGHEVIQYSPHYTFETKTIVDTRSNPT